MKTNDWRNEDEHAVGSEGEHGGAEGSEAPAAAGRAWSKSALGMLGSFAIAMAAIWGIGRQARPAAVKASAISASAQAAINAALAQHGSAATTQSTKITDQLLANFYGAPGALSTPLEQMSGNPFVHGAAVTMVAAGGRKVADAEMDEAHLRRLAEAFHQLKLQTVLVSQRSSFAMINDKLLAVGNHVGEFVLTKIEPNGVVLRAAGREFSLKMSDGMKP